jgi:hypothetical protein
MANATPQSVLAILATAPFSKFDVRSMANQLAVTPSMASATSPIQFPLRWDTIQINTGYGYLQSVGICKVTGFSVEYIWDHKQGKGAQGTTTTYTGRKVGKGKIDFYMWTDYQYKYWDTVYKKLFLYDPTKLAASVGSAQAQSQLAFQMIHPATSSLGINTFICEGVHQHESVSDRDPTYKVVTVKLAEFRPPPPVSAVNTPKGANAQSPNQNGQTPAQKLISDKQKNLAAAVARANANARANGLPTIGDG